MSRTTCRLAQLASLLVLAAIVGCPTVGGPVLSVSPLAISFGPARIDASFQIRNAGAGVLSWQVEEDLIWLSATKQTTQGHTTTEIDVIDLVVVRDGLPTGTYNGEIVVTSNGGTKTVRVSMDVTSPATLTVSPPTLDLGTTETRDTFTITNDGSEDLDWGLQVPAAAGWLRASPASGQLGAGEQLVEVQVDRTGLNGGTYQADITISSNAGTATVQVQIEVLARLLIVNPIELDFGTSGIERTFNVLNGGPEEMTWRVVTEAPDFPAFVTVVPENGTTTTETDTVTVTIDREAAGYDFGTRNEEVITVTSEEGGGTAVVTLVIYVGAFSVDPPSLDFDQDTTQLTLAFRNHGDQALDWTVAADANWLAAATPAGTTSAGGASDIVIEVDHTGLGPGEYQGALTVTSGDQTETVPVSMTVPPPPELVVTPSNLNFGVDQIDKVVAMWNGGVGTVNWRIDASGFPDWLSLIFADQEGDLFEGALTGDDTDSFRVSVDRATMEPTTETAQITITATDQDGNVLEARTISVRMTVAAQPVLGVDTSGGAGAVALGEEYTEGAIHLRNLGTGTLNWSIDPAAFPAWLTISPQPLEGVLETNEDVATLSVTVDRTGLDSGDYEHIVDITWDGGVASVSVTMTVPQPVLALSPGMVDMDTSHTNASVVLSNEGGGWFTWSISIDSDYPWLTATPDSGTVDVSTPQTLTVTVDRSGVAHGDYEGYIDITWSGNLIRLLVTMGVEGPALSVSPRELTFGPTDAEAILTVQNAGDTSRVLTWNISEQPLPWTSADRTVGTTTTEADPVTITIKRSGLLEGTYTGDITFTSNDGEQKIPVTMEVAAFSVDPPEVIIESLEDSATFRIENHSAAALAWTAAENAGWLEVAPATGAIPVGGRSTVTATVSRAGLAPQWYETAVTVAAPGAGYEQAVPVHMRVAAFELDPDLLEFGAIDTPAQLPFDVRNISDDPLAWTATVSEDATWLSVDVVDEQQTAVGAAATVTAAADPAGLVPGEYEGAITIAHGDDLDTVTVTMTVPAPPQLTISPTTLNYGTVATDKLVAIWNSGIGTVNWTINDAAFPAWLTVSANTGAVPDGDARTQAVLVSVDRRGITPPATETYDIEVNATDQDGNDLAPVYIHVSMGVAAVPILRVDSDRDSNGDPIVCLGEEAATAEFEISNVGTGSLNWAIDPSGFPWWLSIVKPGGAGALEGSLTPTDAPQVLEVYVDRVGLPSGDRSHEVTITSNGGAETVRVVITVPEPVLALRFDPPVTGDAQMDFGEDETSAVFWICNSGGDILDWTLSLPMDAEWLDALHQSSLLMAGLTPYGIEEPIEVTVDRSNLPAGDYEAELAITSNGGNKGVRILMTVPGPGLLVIPLGSESPTALGFFPIEGELRGMAAFRSIETSNMLQVRNDGDISQTLIWSIASDYPHWLSFNRTQGFTTQENVITASVDRRGLATGLYECKITFNSNGGAEEVDVDMEVPLFTLDATETPSEGPDPAEIDHTMIEIGGTEATTTFEIENHAQDDLNWTASVDWSEWTDPGATDWFEVDPAAGAVPGASLATVAVNVLSRDGLAPGWHEGPIRITETGTGYAQDLWARVKVPAFQLVLPPGEILLDFGQISAPAQMQFEVQNMSAGDLAWQATVTSGVPWLSIVGASQDVTPPGGSVMVTVQADPTLQDPDEYEGLITVEGSEDTNTVVVRMSVPVPPALSAAPLDMDFGTIATERLLAIWNTGIGVVNWTIDTAGFPAWLALEGAASGSVSGEATDGVTVTVDRTGLSPSTSAYSHEFQITGTDGDANPLENLTVHVQMSVAGIPQIVVDTGDVDQTGVPFINLGTLLNEATFDIRNEGTGVLFWDIDTSGLPSWVISISPSQGSIAPGEQVLVSVVVDRTALEFGGYTYTFHVTSNDLSNRVVDVNLQLQIPKRASIGHRPSFIDIGLYENSALFEVANYGDSGSTLDFLVECNKEWLFFFPSTGRSIGTDSDVKDWQEISISIDRSKLDGTGSTATITIHAYELDEDLNRVIIDEIVTPDSFTVTVLAAPLSFEVANAATRIPSLLRFPMILRNIQYQTIPLPEDQLDIYAEQFTVYEKDVALEITETNQFLTPGSRLRTNVAILLDYSGSMFEAANLIDDDPAFDAFAVNHPGEPLDKLHAIYEYYVEALIWELPANYRIAILEFHDRSHAVWARPTLVYRFTKNKDLLVAELRGISIQDHGASEILLELMSTSSYLANADFPYVPFDSADVSALICITDGRITTPPGKVKDTWEWLQAQRTRLFAIGWGVNMNHEPLARIASLTGGHYYPTTAVALTDGEGNPVLDEHGDPILLPTTIEIEDYLTTTASPCDQSIARDLQSQVVFSYVSLNEEPNVKTRIAAGFDDPNDDFGECGLEDQHTIFGDFEQEIYFDEIVGDVNLGQVSLHTDGLQSDNTAELIVRADYIPRNISEFEMTLASAEPFTISRVDSDNGGILWDWTPAPPDPVDVGGVYTTTFHITSPGGAPLRYGEFGDLFRLAFSGVANPYMVHMTINNDLYLDPLWPLEDKYFIYPNAIEVNEDGRIAPAFPTPLFTLIRPVHPDDVYDTFHLGDDENELEFTIENIGGTFPYEVEPVVVLWWEISFAPAWLDVAAGYPELGVLRDGVGDIDTIVMEVDRTVVADDYYNIILITFGHVYGEAEFLMHVWLTVLQAEMYLANDDPPDYTALDPLELDFGQTEDSLSFTIINSGQSTLYWQVFPEEGEDEFPDWLSVNPLLGQAEYDPEGEDDRETVTVTIDRATAPEGAFSYALDLRGQDERGEYMLMPSGDRAVVDIDLVGEVLPPGLYLGNEPPFDSVPLEPPELDFGDAAGAVTERAFVVDNAGQRTMYWCVDAENLPPWLAVDPDEGSIAYGDTYTEVQVTVNRVDAPATFSHTIVLSAHDLDAQGQPIQPPFETVDIAISGTN